jgi:hypothetical protein
MLLAVLLKRYVCSGMTAAALAAVFLEIRTEIFIKRGSFSFARIFNLKHKGNVLLVTSG